METITRHRPPTIDRYGKPAVGESSAQILVREVEPLTGRDIVRQRVGESTRAYTCKLYTLGPVDVVDGDEVTVRGLRFRHVQVSTWRATGSRFDGRVILCGGSDG